MVLETHLIKISPDASVPQIQEVLKTVLLIGGRIEMASGKTVIASFDNSYADLLKKKKGVELVGAVNFRGRKIPKILKKVFGKEEKDS